MARLVKPCPRTQTQAPDRHLVGASSRAEKQECGCLSVHPSLYPSPLNVSYQIKNFQELKYIYIYCRISGKRAGQRCTWLSTHNTIFRDLGSSPHSPLGGGKPHKQRSRSVGIFLFLSVPALNFSLSYHVTRKIRKNDHGSSGFVAHITHVRDEDDAPPVCSSCSEKPSAQLGDNSAPIPTLCPRSLLPSFPISRPTLVAGVIHSHCSYRLSYRMLSFPCASPIPTITPGAPFNNR